MRPPDVARHDQHEAMAGGCYRVVPLREPEVIEALEERCHRDTRDDVHPEDHAPAVGVGEHPELEERVADE